MRSLSSSIKTTILAIGGLLLVLAAARNSMTWRLTQLLGVSPSFWQPLWDAVLELFGHNAPLLFILGSNLILVFSFWFYNAFLLFIDLTGKPNFLQAYKIQEEKQVPVNRDKVIHCVLVVLLNQLIAVAVTALLYPLFRYREMLWDSPLPSFLTVLKELAICLIVEEFGFYYSHRLLHHPMMYKRFHKVHHEWTAPIGIVGLYAHPVESVLSNVLPVLIGPTVAGAHLATMWLWIAMATINTSNSHCGYHFPSFPSPEQHDYHHLTFNQCYGVLGVLDRLHGTNGKFLASVNYKRHITHFSTAPVKVAFPDPPKSD